MEPNQSQEGMEAIQDAPQEQGAPAAPAEQRGGVGPIVGAVIIIALLIFGGLYFWGTQLEKQQNPEMLPLLLGDDAALMPEATPIEDNSDLSTSDEPAAIEADADSAYMAQLEADINADLQAIENY